MNEESSLLWCFNALFRRYKFLRRPFGLRVSPDIFQQKMDPVLEDCEEAIGISDDICVYGRTTAEHDKNLRKTMDTARKYGLVFNKDKCKIRQERIKFYGPIWDKDGSHSDPEKCDRIKSKPKPINREEHQPFLITWGQIILPFIQNGSWSCRVLLPLVILKGRTNELTKILIVFNLKVLITAWDKKEIFVL